MSDKCGVEEHTYLQLWLSAENQTDAQHILRVLTSKRLIVGGSLVPASSHFWWKGETVDLPEYCYVMAFTRNECRRALELAYAELSKEEIPMASFLPMSGNSAFLDYILENVDLTPKAV